MKAELRGATSPISLPNPSLFNTPQSSLTGALKGCLGNLDGACTEKLLLHCASALENNDVTLAQQVMWVLNNVASSNGDPNQRIASWFLRALISRASTVCPTTAMNFHGPSTTTTLQTTPPTRAMSVTELAGYVDLIPWHRFGYCASNGAICRAIQGQTKAHIIDLSITHCMQWPTLIDALAKRPEGPPSIRITVPSIRPPVPPFLNVSIQEVGLRLANFAKLRDVPFEFHVIEDPTVDEDGSAKSSSSKEAAFWDSNLHQEILLAQLDPSRLDLRDDEVLIVNCQNWLRYLWDEPRGSSQELPSTRDAFLDKVRSLNPGLVVVVDEDADLDSSSLTSRITSCFNYLWIPFDALETFMPKDSGQRMEYEADVGYKIENIIGFEWQQRIERSESGFKTLQRMRRSDFVNLPFCEETVSEVRLLLDEHASGWGMKREDEMLVLTWKGHYAVFATTWIPSSFDE